MEAETDDGDSHIETGSSDFTVGAIDSDLDVDVGHTNSEAQSDDGRLVSKLLIRGSFNSRIFLSRNYCLGPRSDLPSRYCQCKRRSLEFSYRFGACSYDPGPSLPGSFYYI